MYASDWVKEGRLGGEEAGKPFGEWLAAETPQEANSKSCFPEHPRDLPVRKELEVVHFPAAAKAVPRLSKSRDAARQPTPTPRLPNKGEDRPILPLGVKAPRRRPAAGFRNIEDEHTARLQSVINTPE